jgi:hypothetical protein
VGAGTIRPETNVWTPGMAEWMPAARTPQIAPLFAATPQPPPPPRE